MMAAKGPSVVSFSLALTAFVFCVSLSARSVVAQVWAPNVASLLLGLTNRGSERVAGGRSRDAASERPAGQASRLFGGQREQSEPAAYLELLEPLLDEVEE